MTNVLEAVASIRSLIPADVLDALAEFDGSATILVANQSDQWDLAKTYEGPQIIQFGSEQLQTFPTRITWNLRATSTSMRHTNAVTMANRKDWNMVLVGERQCEVNLAGKWYPDSVFFGMLLKASHKGADDRSIEQIVAALQQRGLSFSGSMPMYLQHLGADEDRFHAEIAPLFLSLGATDNTDQIRGQAQGTGASQTVQGYRLEGDGIRVSSLEVGTADRTRSKNGAGFIGFLDSTYTTISAIVEADRTIALADRVLNDPAADEQDRALAASRKAEMATYWGSGSSRTRRPFHNWGGTTRTPNLDGSVKFYPTPVPCGRLVLTDSSGKDHAINVWQRANSTTTAATASSDSAAFVPVITASDEKSSEEPF